MYEHASGEELTVVVLSDKDGWYAQGMEIDHSAQADTLEDVKRIFESGLSSLVTQHLSARGNLEALLRPTPKDTWADLWREGKVFDVSSRRFTARQVLKALPFSGISYFEQKSWAREAPANLRPGENKATAGEAGRHLTAKHPASRRDRLRSV